MSRSAQAMRRIQRCRDVLIGGIGSDRLQADSGDDLLIAAATIHDDNWESLRLIRAEWTRTDLDYTGRVEHLSGIAGGLNAGIVLNDDTVLDDGVIDFLSGGSGQDWYFADQQGAVTDAIIDLVAAEIVEEIAGLP